MSATGHGGRGLDWAEVDARGEPAAAVIDENLCHAELTPNFVALVGRLRGPLADGNRGARVFSDADVAPLESLVLEGARRDAVEPIGLRQDEAEGADGGEVRREVVLEELCIAA